MKHRSPIAVLLLTIITLGIYGIVWFVKTKLEMNRQGAKIPTAWLIIIPFVNIWWLWKYSEGVEVVTGGKTSTTTAFLLLFVLGLFGLTIIGMAIVQSSFNSSTAAPVPEVADAASPAAPEAPTPPAPEPPKPEAAPTPPAPAPTPPENPPTPPTPPAPPTVQG